MALYSASQLAFLLTGPARVWVTPPPPSPAASWPSSSEGFPGTTTTSRAAASARDGLCPESWKHILNYDRFDFTLCWIEILVPVIPLALLLLSGSIEAWSLRKLPAKRLSGFRGLGLYRLKLSLVALLSAIEVASIISFLTSGHRSDSQLAALAAGLSLLSYLLAGLLHHYSGIKANRSSSTLLFFWLFTILLNLAELRTKISLHEHSHYLPSFVLFCVSILLQIAIFSAECLRPDPGSGYIKLGDETGHKEVPYVYANIFSRLTFSWMSPMMRKGTDHALDEEDLWDLTKSDTAESLSGTLAHYWNLQLQKKNLTIAVLRAFGTPFFTATIFKLIQDTMAFIQPQLLRRLLSFVDSYATDHPEQPFHGSVIAVGMLVVALTQTAFLHQYFQRAFETGMRFRGGLIGLIYEKSLRLSNDERAGRTTGDIVNFMSTDATRIADITQYGTILWSGVFQMTLAFISLYQLVGWQMFIGVGVMVLSFPINAGIARMQTRMQKAQMKNKDQRTRLMNEILNNIRSIKLYSWENAFANRLFAIRNDKELALLRKMGYLSSFSTFTWNVIPFFVSFSTFALYAYTAKKPLTSQIVFPAISLFQLLQFPLSVLPMVFSSWIEAYVSIKRLTTFLSAKELQADAVDRIDNPGPLKAGDELISVSGGDFAWNGHQQEPTLMNIDLSVRKGDLVCVVGRVGSGKSSLLSAILGEMTRLKGSVKIRGSVAYVSQNPWLQGATVRENIIFGHRFNQEFYDAVLDACAIRPDLEVLVDGDETEIGEKGVTLSGGQRARISLARAVYSRADIILFDDPLSAVDSHVAKHLFEQVIGPGGLLASKARLLCTNNIAFVSECDEIVMLRAGCVIERTQPRGGVTPDTEIGRLVQEFGRATPRPGSPVSDPDSENTAVIKDTGNLEKSNSTLNGTGNGNGKGIRRESGLTRRASLLKPHELRQMQKAAGKKSKKPKEHRSVGSVDKKVYTEYIKANGVFSVVMYLVTLGLVQFLSIMTNVWLKNWSQHNNKFGDNGNLSWYLGIYAAFGLGTGILYYINGILLSCVCVIRAARTLHDKMYGAVLRAPLQFFESTTVGTILNRFSRDVYVADEVLSRVFGGFWRTAFQVTGVIIVVSSSVPAFILVAIPLAFVYKRIQNYYLATSRELKRLDATTKSPIFAAFQETLGGVSTIRAYAQQDRFIAHNQAQIDKNLQAYFPSFSCNRWLAVRLELIGAFLIFAAAQLSVIALVRSRNIDAGLVGLLMSYALNTTQSLNWIVRSATEVETNIVSIERIQEYIDLPSEAPLVIPENRPDDSWPAEGAIVFDDYSTRYREGLDLVLKGVSFTIKPGTKVGVCGRTGAGKSTLTLAIYRVIERVGGKILIDDIDIATIGLHDLRSHLSIIPQDSQCFEGTMRQNLDPEGLATDEQLWTALDQARLKEHVESMEGGLEAAVGEGGSNLSAGQRQLMCLARALLRRRKILVLDEATAAVDPENDKIIQKIIREEFKDCTVFTIAHRLDTILDSDMILVMSQGKVAEYAPPQELLANESSLFYGLCQGAGIV